MPDIDSAAATIRQILEGGTEGSTIPVVVPAQLSTDLPVAWPGVAFDPPDGPWLRLTILEGDATNVSLGRRVITRRPGVVTIQIFTLAGQGDGESRRIGAYLAALFQNRTVDGVRFYPGSYRAVTTEGRFHQANLSIVFEYDYRPA